MGKSVGDRENCGSRNSRIHSGILVVIFYFRTEQQGSISTLLSSYNTS